MTAWIKPWTSLCLVRRKELKPCCLLHRSVWFYYLIKVNFLISIAYSEILAKTEPVTLLRLPLSRKYNIIDNTFAFHFEIIKHDFTLFWNKRLLSFLATHYWTHICHKTLRDVICQARKTVWIGRNFDHYVTIYLKSNMNW